MKTKKMILMLMVGMLTSAPAFAGQDIEQYHQQYLGNGTTLKFVKVDKVWSYASMDGKSISYRIEGQAQAITQGGIGVVSEVIVEIGYETVFNYTSSQQTVFMSQIKECMLHANLAKDSVAAKGAFFVNMLSAVPMGNLWPMKNIQGQQVNGTRYFVALRPGTQEATSLGCGNYAQ